jgi:hypothetical protein
VRHVDDPHHAEDEREASREEKKQCAVRDAVESLSDPEFHGSDPRYHPRAVVVNARKAQLA